MRDECDRDLDRIFERAEKEAEPIFVDIVIERFRQDRKWGEHNHSDEIWQQVLVEEVGEVSRAILNQRFHDGPEGDVKKELIQVAAVAVAWLECIKRREGNAERKTE